MAFGNYIKEKRIEKKLSLREAARLSEMSHPYLSQLENGKNSKPSIEIIQKLSKGLGIPNGSLMMAAGYVKDPFEYSTNQKKATEISSMFNTPKEELFNLFTLLDMDVNLYYKDKLLTSEEKEKIKIMLHTLLE
ncbi:helix-turn-helix domain-containing protein [Bacillus wiedmannii]|uniref:helix-turn-helix domain-containing protein n=1 Tax=Bacillus wiedmannii TaxID=1890302 RepID=UPI00211D5D2D|nr:helix-turn-helix transcriptional regulator [Bacillus wiedmannii]